MRVLEEAVGCMREMVQLDRSRDTVDHPRVADAMYWNCWCKAQKGEEVELMDQIRDVSQACLARQCVSQLKV
jgi:hypothetical protein